MLPHLIADTKVEFVKLVRLKIVVNLK